MNVSRRQGRMMTRAERELLYFHNWQESAPFPNELNRQFRDGARSQICDFDQNCELPRGGMSRDEKALADVHPPILQPSTRSRFWADLDWVRIRFPYKR